MHIIHTICTRKSLRSANHEHEKEGQQQREGSRDKWKRGLHGSKEHVEVEGAHKKHQNMSATAGLARQ